MLLNYFSSLKADPGLIHFITTKEDGNISASARRLKITEKLQIAPTTLITAKQIHGDHIAIVEAESEPIPETDAMLTNHPGLALMVLTADCVPILLYDPRKKVVGAVHAGWRGTVKQIVLKTIQKMQADFGTNPAEVLAATGPSVGPNCYAVGEEVIAAVKSQLNRPETLLLQHGGQTYFDLWEANRFQLLEAGLKTANLESAKLCTHCETDRFFSVRRDPAAGRFGTGIMLKGKK